VFILRGLLRDVVEVLIARDMGDDRLTTELIDSRKIWRDPSLRLVARDDDAGRIVSFAQVIIPRGL